MIKIHQLHKRFGAQVVLDGVDLHIERGKTTAIVGPSGTGKSVLLKIITGLLTADAGEVLIDGESMTAAKSKEERQALCRRMGVLFQSAALFDSLTLLENVAFPLRYTQKGLSDSEILSRSFQRLKEVGLASYQRALPGEVSIGMRKRVGIARALVTQPEVLLFDEPNTGLDPQMGQEIYDLIQETQEARGFTGIVVSHELPEVFQVCHKVTMIYGGKVQIDGSVEEFLACDKPVVRQFMRGEIEGPIRMAV